MIVRVIGRRGLIELGIRVRGRSSRGGIEDMIGELRRIRRVIGEIGRWGVRRRERWSRSGRRRP